MMKKDLFFDNHIFGSDRLKEFMNEEEIDEFKGFYYKNLANLNFDQDSSFTDLNDKQITNVPFYFKSEICYEAFSRLDKNDKNCGENIIPEDALLNKSGVTALKLLLIKFLNGIDRKNFELLKRTRHELTELPIYAYKQELLDLIKHNQLILVIGTAGCGKSTQIPQYLLYNGYTNIVCTQPRRVSCIALAERVRSDTLNDHGSDIAHQVRFSSNRTSDSKLTFMTEGMLLNLIQKDPNLSQFNLVILDEVHERQLNCDIIMGVLKQLLLKRSDLKIIIMSATLNKGLFLRYFSNPPLFEIHNRPYKVWFENITHYEGEKIFDPYKMDKFDPAPYINVMKTIDKNYPISEGGDLLIFLSNTWEIEQTVKRAIEYSNCNNNRWLVLPFHASLSPRKIRNVFRYPKQNQRKVIIATNIAETSLTIDGIRFVCDSGRINQMTYDFELKTKKLTTVPISKSCARQRKGRAGRTGPGVCFRMYSKLDYDNFVDFPQPEIYTANIQSSILKMIDIGLDNPINFPFIDPLPIKKINEIMNDMNKIGAIQDNKITFLGRVLSKLPLDASVSLFIINSYLMNMLKPSVLIASSLGLSNPFHKNFTGLYCGFLRRIDESHYSLTSETNGDLILIFKTVVKWMFYLKFHGAKVARRWCEEMSIYEHRLREIVGLSDELSQIFLLIQETETSQRLKKQTNSYFSAKHDTLYSMNKKSRGEKEAKKIFLDENYNYKTSKEFNIDSEDSEEEEYKDKDNIKLSEIQDCFDDSQFLKINPTKTLKLMISIALGLYPSYAATNSSSTSIYLNRSTTYITSNGQKAFIHPGSMYSKPGININNIDLYGKQPSLICFGSFLKTSKNYLCDCTLIPAIPSLLLKGEIKTSFSCNKFLFDNWILVVFSDTNCALRLLFTAIKIRNNLIDFSKDGLNFGERFPFRNQENYTSGLDDDSSLQKELLNFFKCDIPANLSVFNPMMSASIYQEDKTFETNAMASISVTLKEKFKQGFNHEMKHASCKTGYSITPYLTIGCLKDASSIGIFQETVNRPSSESFICPICQHAQTSYVVDFLVHVNKCK